MMNAMAPNAPMGATFMIQDMILKTSSRTVSMRLMTGRQRSRPMTTMAAPKKTEKKRTWSRLLFANAPMTLVGITSRMKEAASLGAAFPVWAFRASCESELGSIWSPAPGWTRFPTIRPKTNAKSVAPVKYRRALTPTLPTALTSPTAEMPVTITRKISGAMIILMS